MIQEDYVSFEVAKLLKEKGFDESVNRFYEISTGKPSLVRSQYCRNSFTTDYAAPTHQMAMKWLRDAHNIHINGDWAYKNKPEETGDFSIEYYMDVLSPTKVIEYMTDYYPTYEEAVEAALKYCLTKVI